MSSGSKLGKRIKAYEQVFATTAVPRMPLMIRVDGRAFHTLTQNAMKPFDRPFIDAMLQAALHVATNMQGFKAGYVQSDEATFCLTDYDDLDTSGWFGYKLQKVVSISAALMSVAFTDAFATEKMPVFDSRAFSIPVEDVTNAFLWRAQDWERNSLHMYCRSFFSHAELRRKNRSEMHEMLYQVGKNWTKDLRPDEKNGTFILRTENGFECRSDVMPRYLNVADALGDRFAVPDLPPKPAIS